jgi:2-hydroxy-6-oxonona-2,4-dienedioate hydrolase
MINTHHSLWLDLLGAEVRTYNAAGVPTRAIEYGTGGVPLVLLHGVGGHAEAYARNVVPLGASFRTIAIDYLGHGLSGGIEGSLSKEAYAKHLVDFLDAAGIEKANVLGESLGGWIAVWTSFLYPERINKIVYAVGAKLELEVDAAAAARTAHGRDELIRLTKQFNAQPSRENVRARLNWLFHKPERDVTDELVELRWALYRRELSGTRGHGGGGAPKDGNLTPDLLRKVVHPTLVLWTEHNPSAGPAEARAAMQYLPNAELTVMGDCGHWPQWEHPDEFNAIVRDYLTKP